VTKPGALHSSWQAVIGDQFTQPHMVRLKAFLQQEKQAGKIIYPPGLQIFNAFNHTPFDQVRVVIIGQDPYHGPGQAHGLSFSVPVNLKPLPPSLQNIDKELASDLGIEQPAHGDLTAWAQQGVLLLNATLTVEAAQAGSHQQRGWESFTDATITALNQQRDGLVFILWGSYAQKKGAVIDGQRHLILKSPHPSPLSAHRGFFGSKPFSATNLYLQQQGQQPVDWRR
jgi:uracil-DNA glycosylase